MKGVEIPHLGLKLEIFILEFPVDVEGLGHRIKLVFLIPLFSWLLIDLILNSSLLF